MATRGADFSEDDGTLRFTGELTLARLGDVPARLEALRGQPRTVDLSDVERMDTVATS